MIFIKNVNKEEYLRLDRVLLTLAQNEALADETLRA